MDLLNEHSFVKFFHNFPILVVVKTTIYTLILFIFLVLASVHAEQQPRITPFSVQKSFNDMLSHHQLEGVASYYGKKFHNKRTANGEIFNMNELTAAHRTLPFGTVVEVTNQTNNKRVTVRINDRGPFVKNRVIDLSKYAASVAGMINSGTAPVRLKILRIGKGRSNDPRLNGASSIQVASYSQRKYAEEVVEYLRTHDISADLEQSNQFYRVVIVNLHDETQLTHAQNKLASLGFENVLVRKVFQ